MAGLGAAAKAAALQLRSALAGEAGIPASLDPDSVQVPGAWIRVQRVTPTTLGGGATVRLQVHLLAPAVGTLEAWDLLSELLDKALTVIDPDEPVNTAANVVLPHTPTQPLPAFVLVVDELVDPE